jgi:hypothetical protein
MKAGRHACPAINRQWRAMNRRAKWGDKPSERSYRQIGYNPEHFLFDVQSAALIKRYKPA